MPEPKNIGFDTDHRGHIISNFVLWPISTVNSLIKLLKAGHIAFDTDKKVPIVRTTATDTEDAIREINLRELEREVTDDYTIIPADDRRTIWASSSTGLNVTVDDTLPDGFYTEIYNAGAGAVNVLAGTATVNFPDGYILQQNKICTIFKRRSNGEFYVKGELTT